MNHVLLNELESALVARNPVMSQLLQPGLSEDDVSRLLDNAQVSGAIAPLIALYSWKNGTTLCSDMSLAEGALFPNTIYQFLPLESAIDRAHEMESAASFHPHLAVDICRYFPMFWDHGTGFIVLDTTHVPNSVALIDFEDVEGVRQVYRSFDDFIRDATRANKENDILSALRPA